MPMSPGNLKVVFQLPEQ